MSELEKTFKRAERALRTMGAVFYHPTRSIGWQVQAVKMKGTDFKVRVKNGDWYSVESPSQVSIVE